MPAHSPVGAKSMSTMAGLLTYPDLIAPSQNRSFNDMMQTIFGIGLTAAGTVPDFHRIPF